VARYPGKSNLPGDIDLRTPSIARVYDYFLGGTENWAVDREFGNALLERFPLLGNVARANRQFLNRVVQHLAKLGVRQFVDIGAGVPTMGSTHQTADTVDPTCHVVYIDNDPVAIGHSQALLHEHGDPARHATLPGDLRDPEQLWRDVRKTGLIDQTQPVALLIIAVLHVQQTDERGVDIAAEVLARYRDLLPSGSYLAISQVTNEGVSENFSTTLTDIKAMYDQRSSPVVWRSQADIKAFFGDFELIDPGLTWTPLWHPEYPTPGAAPVAFGQPNESVIWAGVGRKP
jgi:O-methyltransferase involved in polyketide biosynthesis